MRTPTKPAVQQHARRGAMIVLCAVLVVMVFAFAAFVVDAGYITLTRNELQKTSDAAALAAALELPDAYGLGANATSTSVQAAARDAAIAVAGANRAGGLTSTYLDGDRDIRFGRYSFTNGQFTTTWGTAPFNVVEVTARRNQTGSTNGDGPLDLFFAPVLGSETASTQVVSRAALAPATGFRIESGSSLTIGALPITLDEQTWNALLAGTGSDSYSYNSATGAVTSGADGILEVNVFPNGSASLPPGNRGTVDLGSPSNSTADLVRQIRYGLSDEDMSYFPNNEINFGNGPIQLNGDTGISAGIKDDLTSIVGQPRAIPIFTSVSGPGNNAMYTVNKFVGVRVMHVKLTGQPNGKHVLVQPCSFYDPSAVTSWSTTITQDTIWGPPGLIP